MSLSKSCPNLSRSQAITGFRVNRESARYVLDTVTAPGHFEAVMHLTDAFRTFQPMDIRVRVSSMTDAKSRSALRVRLGPARRRARGRDDGGDRRAAPEVESRMHCSTCGSNLRSPLQTPPQVQITQPSLILIGVRRMGVGPPGYAKRSVMVELRAGELPQV
jgi:hypothetical protein